MQTKIYFNAKIHTLDGENSIFEAMAVRDGKVLALDTDGNIMSLRNNDTSIVNLKGRTVIPGIIDTHTHIFGAALSELEQKIFIPQSVGELLDYVRDRVLKTGKNEWIYIPNVYPARLEQYRYPYREELDLAAPDNPVFLDGAYSYCINTSALEKAGGDKKKCRELARKNAKRPDKCIDNYKKGILNIQREYNRVGITSVIDAFTDSSAVEAVNQLHARNSVSVRVVYTAVAESAENACPAAANIKSAVKTPPAWGKPGFLKVFLDGGILTGTAYMRKPYKECEMFGSRSSGYRGNINYSSEQLVDIVNAACKTGMQMTAHCIGDAALDVLLDAYEAYGERNELKSRRFSIIHGDFTDVSTLERIRKSCLYLLFQPAWHYMDAHALRLVLDSKTIKSFLPYRKYIELGINAAAGSDHMIKYDSVESINPFNPFIGLYNMVTAATRQGNVVAGHNCISRQQALRMYTTNAARASFDEKHKGSLEAGKAADFTVLSDDYFNCQESRIKDIKSVLTVVDGKTVFEILPSKI